MVTRPEELEQETQFLTFKTLKEINESSISKRRNRNVLFNKLVNDRIIRDDATLYPVTMAFIHNEHEMRTRVILSGNPFVAVDLDMSFEEFDALRIAYPVHEKYQNDQI